AYYFRRTFIAPSLPCEELLLSATCTDGGGKSLEVYLNGTKLVTSGIDAVSGQGNDVQYFDLAPVLDLIRPGTNCIAVVVNNVWQPSWDDVAFDLSLKAITYAPVGPRITAINREPGLPQTGPEINLGLSAPANSIWRIESSDSLSSDWQLVDVVTSNSTRATWLRDTGQNGRLPLNEISMRFYRLIPNYRGVPWIGDRRWLANSRFSSPSPG